MSSVANWSYTATATIWRRIRDAEGSDTDGGGQPYGWEGSSLLKTRYGPSTQRRGKGITS